MSSDPTCTVYIGNLDERVTDRVLYDILIQAGRVVDLHIPNDKETDKPKGFAFAEYENEEIADYAVRLFTGLVTLYNRTLRFGISGQDKVTPNMQATYNSFYKSRHYEDAATNTFSRSHVDHKIHENRRGFGTSWDGYTRSRYFNWDVLKTKGPKPIGRGGSLRYFYNLISINTNDPRA